MRRNNTPEYFLRVSICVLSRFDGFTSARLPCPLPLAEKLSNLNLTTAAKNAPLVLPKLGGWPFFDFDYLSPNESAHEGHTCGVDIDFLSQDRIPITLFPTI